MRLVHVLLDKESSSGLRELLQRHSALKLRLPAVSFKFAGLHLSVPSDHGHLRKRGRLFRQPASELRLSAVSCVCHSRMRDKPSSMDPGWP